MARVQFMKFCLVFILSLCWAAQIDVPCTSDHCSYNLLATAASQAQDNDTVVVPNAIFVGVCGGAIFNANSVSVLGNDTTIQCVNSGHAFVFSGQNSLLSGFRFNESSNAVAVLFSGNGGSVVNCEFCDNTAGAISSLNLFVSDTTFVFVSSPTSGASIYANGTLTVELSQFTFGNSSQQGGAIYVSGAATIRRSIFTGCTSALEGGAIYTGGTLLLNGSNIQSNCVTNVQQGGAVFVAQDATIANCQFTFNGLCPQLPSASTSALVVVGNTIVQRTYFTGNVGALGGAIYTRSLTTQGGSSFFQSNTATGNGGAIWASGDVNLSSAQFTFNDANGTGACIHQVGGGLLSLNGGTFIGSTASGDGGAIWTDSAVTVVSFVQFNSNSAFGSGGAIRAGSFAPTTSVVGFQGNTAMGNGGAVYLLNGLSNASPNGFLFTGNSAGGEGGAVAVAGPLALSNAGFIGNSALLGGAIFVGCAEACACQVNAVDFEGNDAWGGGALYLSNATAEFLNSTFTGNSAGTSGGAIELAAGSVTFSTAWGNSFVGNTAPQGGTFSCSGGVLPSSEGLPQDAANVACSACGCCSAMPGTLTPDCFLFPGQPCGDVTCAVGYNQIGANNTSCVTPPYDYTHRAICEVVVCQALNSSDVPANAAIVPGTCEAGQPYGSACNLTCVSGYQAEGTKAVGTCTAAGVFAGQTITCVEIPPSASPSPPPPPSNPGPPTGAIVGGVVGGLVVIGLCAGLYYYFKRRRAASEAERQTLMAKGKNVF